MFSWDWLTATPGPAETMEPFSVLFLVVFATGFIVSTSLYYRPWQPPLGRYFRRRAVRNAMTVAMWVFGVGLFFFLIRLLQINPFTLGMRLWMVLAVIAALVLLGVFAVRFWQARQLPMDPTPASRLDQRGRLPYAPAGGRRPVRRRPR